MLTKEEASGTAHSVLSKPEATYEPSQSSLALGGVPPEARRKTGDMKAPPCGGGVWAVWAVGEGGPSRSGSGQVSL